MGFRVWGLGFLVGGRGGWGMGCIRPRRPDKMPVSAHTTTVCKKEVQTSKLIECRFSGSITYLDPEEPTFLGLLIMISLYTSLKR